MLDVWQQRIIAIKSNRFFELFAVGVIIFSALLIGAHTYTDSAEADESGMLLTVLDGVVTLFFLVEILIRFMAEKNKKDFFRNAWNVFDTLIVIVSLLPIDNSEMAVLGRLIRIFRVLRMVSLIPELRILLNSLFKALPQLGYVMMLMFIIFYIYAAVGSNLFESVNPTLWGISVFLC